MVSLLLILVFAQTVQAGVRYNNGLCAYSKEDIREKLRKKFEFDYRPYLKGKKKLWFHPSEDLYSQVYHSIKQIYVEPVDNKTLIEGVFAEVKRLLKQAKVDPSGLKNIPHKMFPMKEIVRAYGDKVNPDLLRLACIRGLLEALNDPYSVLLLPDEYKRLEESMRGGDFYGIGVFIMSDPDNYNWLTVSEPIEGTPAYKAGLKPGDVIIAIDGKSTKGEPLDVSVARIRGPANTIVRLTIKRKGVKKPFVVPIKRGFIHVNSVKACMIGKKIGYIKLRMFGFDSNSEMEKALKKLKAKGAKAIILDLRNNSGGLLDAATYICSKFLPKGAPIVTVVKRGGEKEIDRSFGGEYQDIPMVVLVNELSASASEITAGALKDNKRAILIGERTFGKGSVQQPSIAVGSSQNPAALKLTIGLFYSPSGRKIRRQGVEPDIKVPMDLRKAGIDYYKKGEDIQLKKAVEYLLKKIGG